MFFTFRRLVISMSMLHLQLGSQDPVIVGLGFTINANSEVLVATFTRVALLSQILLLFCLNAGNLLFFFFCLRMFKYISKSEVISLVSFSQKQTKRF